MTAPRKGWRRALRSQRDALRALEIAAADTPAHRVCSQLEDLAWEQWAGVYARRGLAFRADAEGLAAFDQHLAGGPLRREDLLSVMALAERRQAAREALTGDGTAPVDPALAELAAEQLGVTERLEAWLEAEAEAESGPTVGRRRWAWWAASVAVAAVALGLALSGGSGPVDPALITAPGGIVGVYYAGESFEREVLTRVDRRIQLHTRAGPAPGLAADHFSVRWRGFLAFGEAGRHHLCTVNDDGVRLWLGEELLIDDWEAHIAERSCVQVDVAAGWHPLTVEYFERKKEATLQVLVGRRATTVTEVPPEHLCCADGGGAGAGQ